MRAAYGSPGTRRGPSVRPAPFRRIDAGSADGHDVRCLGALLALAHLELDLRALGEGAKAVTRDRAEVDEDILAAPVRGDEAIALRVVEPLHGSGRHLLEHLPSQEHSLRVGRRQEAPPNRALSTTRRV